MSGARMASEMAEQPEVIARLLERRAGIATAVRSLLPRPMCGLTLVARGSSDHAALYARYLLEMTLGRPAGLAAPSVQTLYGADVDYRGYLAIAISQSGRTPEVVTVLERMRLAGARTLAIVNAAGSPLTEVADLVIDLEAGEERAIPATKTFTATLVALALLATALGDAPWMNALPSLPQHVERMLGLTPDIDRVAGRLMAANRVLVTTRGLLFSAAAETALKLREATTVFAEALSTADVRHGPIAAVTPEVPVLALSAGGPSKADIDDLVASLRARDVVVSTMSSEPNADVSLPDGVPEQLQPVLASVRGQQLALRGAHLRRIDPDEPAGLTKVTLTH